MPTWLRWCVGTSIPLALVVVSYVYFRHAYSHSKRLREVKSGQLYRSGQLTQAGFEDAVQKFGIKTIVNLQEEAPDPQVAQSYFDRSTIRETELCQKLGVKYVHIAPDVLPRTQVPPDRPKAIDQYLSVMDDPANFPVLIHCRAGLHRTGLLSAIYRMEYQHWPVERALRELRDVGFGEYASSADNVYITQYLLTYRPGERKANVAGPFTKLPHAFWSSRQ